MTKSSIPGKPFAKVANVKEGDRLVSDAGFTCIKQGTELVIQADKRLFVDCVKGRHYLEGQIEDGEYVGLYPA